MNGDEKSGGQPTGHEQGGGYRAGASPARTCWPCRLPKCRGDPCGRPVGGRPVGGRPGGGRPGGGCHGCHISPVPVRIAVHRSARLGL